MWLRWLRIWYCQCGGLDHCCGTGLIPGELPHAMCSQKKPTKNTIMRYQFIPTRMAIIKKKIKRQKHQKITSVGKDAEKLKPSYIVNRNVKWFELFLVQPKMTTSSPSEGKGSKEFPS